MVSLEDHETQLKGSLLIYYAMRAGNQTYSCTNLKMVWMTRSVPLRIVGVNACYDNPVLWSFLDLAAFLIENARWVWMRHHFGKYKPHLDATKKNYFPLITLYAPPSWRHTPWSYLCVNDFWYLKDPLTNWQRWKPNRRPPQQLDCYSDETGKYRYCWHYHHNCAWT